MASADINPGITSLIKDAYIAIPSDALSQTQSKKLAKLNKGSKVIDADIRFIWDIKRIVLKCATVAKNDRASRLYRLVYGSIADAGADPYFFKAKLDKNIPTLEVIAPLGSAYVTASPEGVNVDLRELRAASLNDFTPKEMVFSSQEPLRDVYNLCEAVKSLSQRAARANRLNT